MQKRKYLLIALLFTILLVSSQADLCQKYTPDVPKTEFSHMSFEELASFNRDSLSLSGQSREWTTRMETLGRHLRSSNVASIYFVHGTFVGNDPLGILTCIKCVYPDLSPEMEQKLKGLIKTQTDKILKDMGNYTDEYVSLFENAIGREIPCHNFHWSSGNYHIARVRGAVRLVRELANDIQKNNLEGKRLLMMGHSHAGQVFALLSHFLEKSSDAKEILRLAEEDEASIMADIDIIKKVKLDIVTFATPPRYTWGKGDYRLLNIINHRGDDHLGGSMFGLLTTKDGDYVQQWGIAGTDLLASNPNDISINLDLNKILGPGLNPAAWLENTQPKKRVPNSGKTILVDYKDNSTVLPNCISSFFGHGVYTTYEKMLFNTNVIVKELYK